MGQQGLRTAAIASLKQSCSWNLLQRNALVHLKKQKLGTTYWVSTTFTHFTDYHCIRKGGEAP